MLAYEKKTRHKKVFPNVVLKTTEGINAEVTLREMSTADRQIIVNSCRKNFILRDLPEDLLSHVIDNMQHLKYPAKSIVFKEGDNAKCFYVICSGRVNVVIGGEIRTVLLAGQSFGELALIHNTPRSATITTACATEVWALDGD
jgi:CRP-like cAMP-binding protein